MAYSWECPLCTARRQLRAHSTERVNLPPPAHHAQRNKSLEVHPGKNDKKGSAPQQTWSGFSPTTVPDRDRKLRIWTSRHSFWTLFVVFLIDEPQGSYSPVHGAAVCRSSAWREPKHYIGYLNFCESLHGTRWSFFVGERDQTWRNKTKPFFLIFEGFSVF